MSNLRVGIIGAGGISQTHLPHLATRSDAVQLSAVADVNSQAAAATAAQYGIEKHFTDYRDMLGLVDAVLICLPTHLHGAIAINALKAGIAVFSEKPMARKLEDAIAMKEASDASGVPLQIGFVRRFDAGWLAFREQVLENRIGRPVVWRHLMGNSGASDRAWFCTEEQGGGPFLDGCIHNIDFALHTLGPAEWAFAHLRTLSPRNTALDTGTSTVRFQSGDELMLAWSWGLPAGCVAANAMDVLGPAGCLTWPGDEEAGAAQRRLLVNNGDRREDVWTPANSITTAFAQQMDEFIEVANRRAAPRAGSREGIESLRVALAILESGRTGNIVRL